MINNLYTIYDRVEEECGPIFEAKNDGVARRGMKQMFEQGKFKGDLSEYALILIGSFDNEAILCKGLEITKVVSLEYGKAEDEDDEN